MAFEKVKLFGIIELDVESTAGGTLRISTDLPGNVMTQRATMTIPVSGRRAVRSREQGTLIGRYLQLAYSGSGITRLYGGRVWAREMPSGQWQWYPLPIITTPEEWTTIHLPIPPTEESWQSIRLPIPVTAEEWMSYRLPLAKTGDFPVWVSVPVDQ